MSKIDTYQKVKNNNGKAIGDLRLSLRRNRKGEPDTHHNDKGCFRFYDHKIWDSDMPIIIHSCHGYYGSSSAYAIGDSIIKQYILQSLNKNHQLIVEDAIEMMKEDIEKARLDAENEAKEVLLVVNS